MPRAKDDNNRARSAFRSLRELTAREKQVLIDELMHVKGLMPLLMKQRNQQHWTAEDRVQLASHMKRLSKISPCLAVLAIPGGFLMLPALAWWLDRRRGGRRTGTAARL